jgi:DNA-binding transcriptional LysR family regulator
LNQPQSTKLYLRGARTFDYPKCSVRQIQQLEEFLNLELFNRTRHGVELTLAGEQYFKSIKSSLLNIEQSTIDLMSHKGLVVR